MLRIHGNQYDDTGWQQTTPSAHVQFRNRQIRKSVATDVRLLCGVSEWSQGIVVYTQYTYFELVTILRLHVPNSCVGQADKVLAVVADKEHAIRNGLKRSKMKRAEIAITCALHNKWSTLLLIVSHTDTSCEFS